MLALLLALFAANASPAQEAVGIWEGQVGDLPVRACFDETSSDMFGAYYYRSTRQLIPLERESDRSTVFRGPAEDPAKAPTWRIESIGLDEMRGTWSRGPNSLPVRLTRVPVRGDLDPCQHIEFHRPRLDGVAVTQRSAEVDGVKLRWLKLDPLERFSVNVETFALEPSGAATDRINGILAESFAGDPPEWFECIRGPLDHGPHEGDFHRQIEPVMISGRWLSVIDRIEAFCGGAHPSGSGQYRLFDRQSGLEVDLREWFVPAAVIPESAETESGFPGSVAPAFRDVLLSGWASEAPECEAPVRTAESWNIGLTRTGMVFSPDLPHVVRACSEDFALSFERLRPFLTETALAAIGELDLGR